MKSNFPRARFFLQDPFKKFLLTTPSLFAIMPSTRNGHVHQDTPSKEPKGEGDEDSSASEEDSCSYDEGESERRKYRCLDDMVHLEQQFSEMRELLYKERMEDIEKRIHLLSEDSAPEYINPVKELQDSTDMRQKFADLHYKCKIVNIQNKYEQESQSAHLDFTDSCEVTRMRMIAEIEEKIQRLQEEHVLNEITLESRSRKRKLKSSEFLLLEKRKKPVTVTGPYVVYMLRDMDIMEDLNDIRRGMAASQVKWRYSVQT